MTLGPAIEESARIADEAEGDKGDCEDVEDGGAVEGCDKLGDSALDARGPGEIGEGEVGGASGDLVVEDSGEIDSVFDMM